NIRFWLSSEQEDDPHPGPSSVQENHRTLTKKKDVVIRRGAKLRTQSVKMCKKSITDVNQYGTPMKKSVNRNKELFDLINDFTRDLLCGTIYQLHKKEEICDRRNGSDLSYGHVVLRLPPYHCILNPIEMIWSEVKRKVASKNLKCLTLFKNTQPFEQYL
ncbi:hypothetical protein ANN_11529, partial [Periplaneta americana]